jgi:poly(3-hydroxybutyrate) depolymerase
MFFDIPRIFSKGSDFSATVLCFALICFGGNTSAVTVDNFVPRKYTNSSGVLPYRLFIPTNYSPAQKLPLVLFMHGAGESGSDNRYQLVGQTGALVFASETNQLKYPSFMVAPQCPMGSSWADSNIRLRVAGLMAALQSEFGIDADRLYITGLSLGGFGTWEYISRYTNMYAAAIPMSGADTTGQASLIRPKIPIWNFHAVDDNVVSEGNSSAIIDLLRRAGGNPIYTRYATGGHAIWTFAYNTPVLMDWVYAQKRGSPAALPPRITIDGPLADPIYAANEVVLNLTGTADDSAGRATAVNWAIYRTVTGPVAVSSGTASGTTNWAVTNISLSTAFTNILIVTGRGTTWYAFLGGSTTFSKTTKIIFPPYLTMQPADQMVNEGDPAQFNVTASVLPASPRYQWRFNGTNIQGATGATLILTNAHFADAGFYSAQLSNQFGTTLSSNAMLVVNRYPVAQCSDIIVSAGLNCSAIASIDRGSFDLDADQIIVSQSPSGPYALGTNFVLLTVIDSKGASNSCMGSVIVVDRTPPGIVCHDIVVTNAHSQVSSIVTFGPSVSDDCSAVGTPVCIPPSGSAFAVGTHPVVCSVADVAGNASQCSFNLIVWPGNVPPVPVIEISPLVQFPGYTNLAVASPSGTASLMFDASKSYDVDDSRFSYSWYSGTNVVSTNAVVQMHLDVGSHEITLTLDDDFPMGVKSTNLIVNVITPVDAITLLMGLVQDSGLSQKSKHPLIVSLAASAASFERGNIEAGWNQLNAFEEKVRAQVVPFNVDLGNHLIQIAQELMNSMGADL